MHLEAQVEQACQEEMVLLAQLEALEIQVFVDSVEQLDKQVILWNYGMLYWILLHNGVLLIKKMEWSSILPVVSYAEYKFISLEENGMPAVVLVETETIIVATRVR